MPTARGWLAVTVVNDLLYAIAGSPYVMGSSLPTNEQYVPFGFGTPAPSNGTSSPEIKLVSPENQTYHSASIPLEFSSNEPLSRMFYSLDDAGVTEVSGNTTLTGLSLGPHNLTIYATNEAGNAGISQTICFAIEEAEPVSPVALAAVSITVVVAAAGALVYFTKRKHSKITEKIE